MFWNYVFVRNIYVVVSLKDNKWVIDYYWAHFLEGNKTLNMSLIDDEGNGFFIGFVVIKYEYISWIISKEKRVYVFQDYWLGAPM